MTATEKHDLTVRLAGTGVPPGQIDLDSLGGLASSLQELATRVGRHAVGQEGRGRTVDTAAKIVRLRLTGLHEGSTVLDVAFGEHDVLPLDVGAESQIAQRFWEVLDGLGHGARPAWAGSPVAQSALRCMDAMARAASEVTVTRADGRRLTWRPRESPREPWMEQEPSVGEAEIEAEITVSGRLEMVDLGRDRFRIRDDVGNAIGLTDVVDPERAGPLVGRRTRASGLPRRDQNGRLIVQGAVVQAAPMPAEWTLSRGASLDALVESAPGPDPSGIVGVSDEDVAELLAFLRE